MHPVLLAFVLTTPPGFELLREGDDCRLFLGPEPRPRSVRAECYWPEAQLEVVRESLLDFERYPDLVPQILSSVVQRSEDGRELVLQEYRVPFIANREALVWMASSERDDGGVRVDWSPAEEPGWAPSPGHAPVVANHGFWEVGPHPEGGLSVVHEVTYDPGVRLPDWLVRRFRTSGLGSVMAELRKRASGAAGPR